MPVKPPKCKICGEEHWGSVCTKYVKAPSRLSPSVVDRVKEIEGQPLKPSAKGAAKAQKRRKGTKK